MSLFLKFAVASVIVALFVVGLLRMLSALFSSTSSDSFSRLKEYRDDDLEYDEHEMLISRSERERATLL